MKEIEISMVVSAPNLTEDEVSDKFVKWVEENNWSCGGKITDITGSNRNILPSRLQIGEEIAVSDYKSKITAAQFNDSGVSYSLDDSVGIGLTMQDNRLHSSLLPSRFQIGEDVIVNNIQAKITTVKFTEDKVYYGFDEDSLSLALYDSLDVKPIN